MVDKSPIKNGKKKFGAPKLYDGKLSALLIPKEIADWVRRSGNPAKFHRIIIMEAYKRAHPQQ